MSKRQLIDDANPEDCIPKFKTGHETPHEMLMLP